MAYEIKSELFVFALRVSNVLISLLLQYLIVNFVLAPINLLL
jgi:hypothetical protein